MHKTANTAIHSICDRGQAKRRILPWLSAKHTKLRIQLCIWYAIDVQPRHTIDLARWAKHTKPRIQLCTRYAIEVKLRKLHTSLDFRVFVRVKGNTETTLVLLWKSHHKRDRWKIELIELNRHISCFRSVIVGSEHWWNWTAAILMTSKFLYDGYPRRYRLHFSDSSLLFVTCRFSLFQHHSLLITKWGSEEKRFGPYRFVQLHLQELSNITRKRKTYEREIQYKRFARSNPSMTFVQYSVICIPAPAI